MEAINDINIKQLLKDSLKNSKSYQDYRTLVTDLVENKSTTGPNKEEAYVNYTMLNNRRMKRWDKTLKIEESIQTHIKNKKIDQTWVVLTESWCGDAAHVMPAINKVAELNDGIDFKVVLRDENLPLMNQFLTNGGMSIPKLILIDNTTNEVVNTFGPRPSKATNLVNDYKAKHGSLTPEFKEDLQQWYNKDKGQTAVTDLVALI
ncbi:thioredoxin family protein [Olleya sp. R77988]|uniref:thioredoxin family protein n=1 Tax=Olleya sp. R77988 TaxID=3093875 RepID=UPI0037CC3C09